MDAVWLPVVDAEELETSVYTFPQVLSKELLYLIGYALPRLHFHGRTRVSITFPDSSFRDALLSLLVCVFGGEFSVHGDNILVEDRSFCLFFFNLVGARAENKRRIPEFIFSLPLEDRHSFLASLISASSIGDSQDIRVFCLSEIVYGGLRRLLSDFSISIAESFLGDSVFSFVITREELKKISFPENFPSLSYNRVLEAV